MLRYSRVHANKRDCVDGPSSLTEIVLLFIEFHLICASREPPWQLTCLEGPECGPWQHTEARPPWRPAPSSHRLGVLWSGHS